MNILNKNNYSFLLNVVAPIKQKQNQNNEKKMRKRNTFNTNSIGFQSYKPINKDPKKQNILNSLNKLNHTNFLKNENFNKTNQTANPKFHRKNPIAQTLKDIGLNRRAATAKQDPPQKISKKVQNEQSLVSLNLKKENLRRNSTIANNSIQSYRRTSLVNNTRRKTTMERTLHSGVSSTSEYYVCIVENRARQLGIAAFSLFNGCVLLSDVKTPFKAAN